MWAACRQGVCQRLGSPGGRIHLLWLFCLQCHSHSQLPQCGGQWGWQLRGQPGHPLLPPGQLQPPDPERPELQHHVIWDPPGRGGGRGHLLPPHLMPTPCPAPRGSRLEAKEKYPFGIFSPVFCFCFLFFLREVIFYSGFILKEKHKPKKKKNASISILISPRSFPCFQKTLYLP